MNQQAVAGFEHDVRRRLSPHRTTQTYTEDLQFSLWQIAKHLRVSSLCVRSQPSGQVHRVAQTNLTRSSKRSWSAHIAPHRYHWRILEVEPAVYADGVHRPEHRSLFGIRQRTGKVETFHARVIVRLVQPNDFGVLRSRFRGQIFVR